MQTISKAYAKEIAALKLKKYRQKHRKFMVEGPNLVHEAQLQNKYSIECIVGTKAFYESENVIGSGFSRYLASAKDMKRMSALKNAYDCIAVLKRGEEDIYDSAETALYLDGIQDPGNLGTILRSAEWFGMKQILLSNDTVELYNSKVIQASTGSIYRVNCISEADNIILESFNRKLPIIGLSMEGVSIYEKDNFQKAIYVIGSEGKGISDKVRSRISNSLSIPSAEHSKAESLNAAISTSIFLSEWYKKNR